MKTVVDPVAAAPSEASTTTTTTAPQPSVLDRSAMGTVTVDRPTLERKGRLWLLGSFLACPCHLPLTLGVLGVVLGGTALGAVLRDNVWLAGGVITAVWAAGTARGLWLVRQAEKADFACAVPGAATAPAGSTPPSRSGWFRRSSPQS